jgi:hypothetical protein
MYGCSIYVGPTDSTACLLLEDSISVQYRMSSLDNGLSNRPSENNFDLLMNWMDKHCKPSWFVMTVLRIIFN